MYDILYGYNEEARFQVERNNYESYIDSLEGPYEHLAALVKTWRSLNNQGSLNPEQQVMALEVLEALMKMPPQTREDFFGKGLEEFTAELKEKAESREI
jgi:hypothetical protein